MARRFSHRAPIRSGAKRVSEWLNLNLGGTAIVGSLKQVLASLDAIALSLRPFTIVRTRLLLLFQSDQAAVTERPIGSFGIIVANETAVTLGPTALPGLDTLTDGDWFVYESLIDHFQFLSSIGFQDGNGHYTVVDSKAMRKVSLDQDVAIMTELSTASGGFLTIQGRMLIKLH